MIRQRIVQSLPLFRADARRALLEVSSLQCGALATWPLIDHMLRPLFLNSTPLFFLCLTFGSVLFLAFRWRLRPVGRTRWQQLLIELAVGGVLLCESIIISTVTLFLSIYCAPYAFIQFHSLKETGSPTFYSIVFNSIFYALSISSVAFFFLLRVLILVWRSWDRLRREHLHWALTHAHLLVVVMVAAIISCLLMTLAIWSGSGENRHELIPLLILPGMIFLTVISLAFVLPPSALFSYLFARHTTRRIEKLAAATSALRSGNYEVRVRVEGEDEIARLQADFNAMAIELERARHELRTERDAVSTLLNARRELIASVSHELRTPVATVRSYLESTLNNWQEVPPATLQQDLSIMEQQTIRLQVLINDLFTLSRVEVKHLELRCAPTNIELLIRRVAETTAPIAWRGSRVEIVADIEAATQEAFPEAMVDEHRLEQVLQNLLHNGIRHTPPGGIIVLSASATAQEILLQVKDTGEGIAADELPRIWERFYRTQQARQQPASGSGLGLALVKELTEAMGGSVSVSSIQGQGTCFSIRVPQALITNQPTRPLMPYHLP
ncbi:sensor histidine kinase [Tengunoibacter tsumagoiensis]|uniref:histidine kinase n=1 Tax=Tengunoibacter tsumagoiensis TaxID=2014871 RepID=A0A402A6K7_9CHLR|nr:HAMP domain-containing sensor histidine kinase [Tengunoibacter tsumagoiensis]GCE14758.1 hypothetical protein KTT_46170 [Tengunoibacter tsumagoiensis]